MTSNSNLHNPIAEKFELVLNNIAAAVILFSAEGKPEYVSSYFEVLTGYSFEELNSEEYSNQEFLRDIILAEDWDRFNRSMLIGKLGEDSLVRFRIKHKSGLILWIETRMVPLLGIDGELESILSVSIDVTDTINYQKQIEQQNQDLSDFAFMVSHDLKAPIFTIQGMADALIEDHSSSLDQEAKTLINFILNASHRLDRLVASVLEYSSLSSGGEAIEEVSLDEILGQVMNDLSGQIQAKNAIIKAKSELPYIKGESIRVYQVLSNLIGNAIKYSDKSRVPEIEISATTSPPSMIALKVKDNGLGIPENKLEEIFRPYRRAHGGDIEGSGIGLACVKKIVDRLGGQVLVESKEGVGSEFTVILPSAKHLRKPIPEDLKRLF